MPKRPGSYDRESRRYSSGTNSLSSSSVVTVRGPDGGRPSSSSKLLTNSMGASAIVTQTAEIRGPSPNHPSSPSKRLSSASSGRSDQGYNNRWSQSSASNPGLAHLRSSSFSRRFSLAVPSPRTSFRSPSPPKSTQPYPDASSSPSKLSPQPETSRPLSPRSQRYPPTSYFRNDRFEHSRSPPMGPPSPERRFQSTSNLTSGVQSQDSSRRPSQDSRPGSSGTKLTNAGIVAQAQKTTSSYNVYTSEARSRKSSRDELQTRERPDTAKTIESSGPHEKRKKALLSEALQRANDAVQLDNDADYYQAVIAYNEACSLLNDVMRRSSSADDQRKLTAISATYLTRVQELQPLARPKSRASSHNTNSRPSTSDAKKQKSFDSSSDLRDRTLPTLGRVIPGSATAQRPSLSESDRKLSLKSPDLTRRLKGNAWAGNAFQTQSQMKSDKDYAPPPLSPRRSPAPEFQNALGLSSAIRDTSSHEGIGKDKSSRQRDSTGSWYNVTEEGSASLHSSNHHSVSSSSGLRRRDLRGNQGDTEAEFDAALDAAVEAAYNDGYEPYDDKYMVESRNYVDREARIKAEKNAAVTAQYNQDALQSPHDGSDGDSVVDSDEEERLLDQVTRGFPDDAPSDGQQRHSQPRQSDSSGFSNRTYGSSVASSLNTAGTSLSTVDEVLSVPLPNAKPELAKTLPPVPEPSDHEPPHRPPIPQPSPQDAHVLDLRHAQTLEMRQRRPSETGKKLKIETTVPALPSSPEHELDHQPSMEPLGKVQSAGSVSSAKTAPPGRTLDSRLSPGDISSTSAKSTSLSGAPQLSSPYPSPFAASFPSNVMSPSAPLSSTTMSNESRTGLSPLSDSLMSPVSQPGRLMKQSSSTSNLTRLVSDEFDPSPATPMSFSFSSPALKQEELIARSEGPTTEAVVPPATKIKLFDNDIHFRQDVDRPRPLEPCPESVLLRPFWLMRCFHQTIANTKGGYLSNKLFVPHDVWKVKAPKLKAIEDKIATCDYLSAALLKLSTVDPLDADAIHDEMTGFEMVLDETQATLTKKLGSDVGTQNVSSLFKDALPGGPPPNANDLSHQTSHEAKSTSTGSQSGSKSSSKTWQSSWRKLRNKSSNSTMSSSYYASMKDPNKEGRTMTMSSLPMQALEFTRPIKRSLSGPSSSSAIIPKIDGPNANYAAAVAKLCDAAQVLDQIARQVEDPGLRLSSQTHVGLELSARHSAEFFGFYICRFILQDLMMLMDKFLKRATEWVLT